jgi:hypothetical protein
MAKTISAEAILNTPQNQLNLKKYAQRIKIAESVQKKSGKSFGFEQKVALATMLENTRKIMEAAGQGATNSSNIPSKTFFMDMVTAVVPNLIASDIVSTQAMESKASIVSYLRYLYGTDKGATVAGTMFNNSLYTGKSDPNYSSRLIVDEQVVDGVNFEYSPILPGTIVITLPDNTTVIDNGTGNLVDPSTSAQVGTINYATGAFTCATAAEGTTARYEYNNEQVPDLKVPEITLTLAQIPIYAKSRKLAAYWGFDAAYDLKQQYGEDITEIMATQAAAEISYEIDTEIVNDLVRLAGAGTELTWSKIPPTGVNIIDHYDSFWVKLTEGSKVIFQETQRVQPNFIVCGTNVAAVIEVMRQFDGTGGTDGVGPHFIGTLGGKYKVYVVPLMQEDTFVMGYKGSNFLETGYIYAPYMPILSTDLLMPADFKGQQGYATSYGKKMVNSKMYIKGKIVG